MTCCTTTIKPFVNESATTIPFVGPKPTITVSYLVDGVWNALGVSPVINLSGTSVTVDHGGISTGVIKMVQ